MSNPNALRDLTPFVSYGPQFHEKWDDPRPPQAPTRGLEAVWESEQSVNAGTPLIPPSYADDGSMGSRWIRYSATEPTLPLQCNLVPRKFFDALKPMLWKYRMRVVGGTTDFASYGVLYHGEGSYNGCTSNTYGFQIGSQRGVLADIEMQWLPTTRRIRARWKIGSVNWTDWATDSTPETEDILWFGPSLWFGGFDALEIGELRAYGEPAWGCCDHIGFSRWVFTNNAAWYGGADQKGVLGGLCYGTNDTYLGNAVGAANLPSATEWGPVYSPTIGRDDTVTGYRALRFVVPYHDAGDGSYIRIQLFNAADDSLLPDAQVPGNSTGIVSTSTAVAGLVGGGASNWVREIDISGIPDGVEFYIAATGKTKTTLTARDESPRLGAIYVLFNSSEVINLAASTPIPYNHARYEIGRGAVNLATATVKALLVSSAYVPNFDDHQYLDDITNELVGNGYVRQTLIGKTWEKTGIGEAGRSALKSNPTEYIPAGGAITARAQIQFVDTGDPATSLLLSYTLLDTTPADVSANVNFKLRVSPPSSVWLYL